MLGQFKLAPVLFVIGLIELFEEIMSEDGGKWDSKLDEEGIKVDIKMKGSKMTKKEPVVRTEFTF